LLEVKEYTGVALRKDGIKPKVSAKNNVDGVFAQPVLTNCDLCAQAAELVTYIPRLVEKALRVDVARRLNDA
jgi:hypothetical protein